MIIINHSYLNTLESMKSKAVGSPHTPEYYENIGRSFEFKVNSTLMTLSEFILYWRVSITAKASITWTLGGDFFQNNDCNVIKRERSCIEIDHFIVTPYAVFVFESKAYAARPYYVSGDSWTYFNNGQKKNLPNPLNQLFLYKAIAKQIMYHYGVDLPLIGKVVLKNRMDLNFINHNDNEFVYFDQLRDFVNSCSNKYPRNRLAALKLIKSLYYDSCSPIAYDGNSRSWSK